MRLADHFPIPYKEISEEEKIRMEDELRSCNRILEHHHNVARKGGFSGSRRSFFSILCKQPENHEIPPEDLQKIRSLKSLEWDFLCAYSKMILKSAKKRKKSLDSSFSEDDICAVALEGFLNAFCCFTKEDVRFSTYLVKCVSRHMSDFVSSANMLKIPLDILKLKAAVLGRMREDQITFDSALDMMMVPEETRRKLAFSMCDIKNVHRCADPPIYEEEEKSGFSLDSLSGLELCMGDLERLVFGEFMRLGADMNLAEISRRTINPKTGRPYSKMSMCHAWKKVRMKISERLPKVA